MSFINSFIAFKQLLNSAPRYSVVFFGGLTLLSSLTEGIGLLLLVPLLGMLENTKSENPIIEQINHVFQSTSIEPSLANLLIIFVILISLRSLITYANSQLGQHLQHHIVDNMRSSCFAALLQSQWRWIAQERSTNHASLLLTDVSRIGNGLYHGIKLIINGISGLVYISVAAALSIPMTIVTIITGMIALILLSKYRRAAHTLGQQLRSANESMHGNVQESLTSIKLTKILGTEARHLELFNNTMSTLKQQQLDFAASVGKSTALFNIIGGIMLAIYFYWGVNTLELPIAQMLVLALLFSRLIPLLMSSHQQYQQWLHAMPALSAINDTLAQCELVKEPIMPSNTANLPIAKAVTLQAVSITYDGRDKPALDNITLSFPANTTTAIMGHSGAGKSTLADVLMGLITPDTGELMIDNKHIDDNLRITWRNSVSYVPQEPFLFHNSIRQNLSWGKADATEAEMKTALALAAADFVFQLPQGLDTIVGDGGVRLSGGERQRIALARALLKKPSLLILDEATSALDIENETRIRQAIEGLHGNLTVVIIGHRLATLEHADKVIVLEQGRIKTS